MGNQGCNIAIARSIKCSQAGIPPQKTELPIRTMTLSFGLYALLIHICTYDVLCGVQVTLLGFPLESIVTMHLRKSCTCSSADDVVCRQA